ncbi:MAG: 30S ribosomal protein S8 [Tissierellia bacterium]|jgi:small subunit ribosomal protein S8|nr:30S ribosomal protein S8 [Tissierellia bacterium]MDD3226407.1 30S ribosomal protein S8 [Tissierellia bacterium]MDD3750598.1 30S ribosomal protein S8 [Tissierellia bacterium]MDD4046208.1 30S ribosomal protein S8 [Tissierellia bacterium]MDD4678552.1 30S ribosomal protein S8 [Tissierellia bacterium]
MVMTDPIADMLTRIRNANHAKHEFVDIPASKIKKEIANILLEEGYIKGFDVIDDGKQGIIRVELKYQQNKERVITGIKRISKPGLRVYVGKEDTPRVLGGLGIAIISTSKGIVTDKRARTQGVGGEVICYVW